MSRFVLISIHPEHAYNILAGKKVFEYRKVIPSKGVTHLVLYCTAPVKKIVAVAEVLDYVVGSPTHVWNLTVYGSGISRQFFRNYFSGQRSANAIVLGTIYKMPVAIELRELRGKKTPPQSFSYLDDADAELVLQRITKIPVIPPSMLFVGGIHGVGKSTICHGAFSPLGYQCETASSLIITHGRSIEKNKHVSDVPGNQSALIEQLILAKKHYSRLLLDGHFTLINRQGQIEPIDTCVFEAINPDQLILIKGETEEISRRLNARDSTRWDSSFLTKYQDMETEHARYVSEKIGVPLQVFDNTVSAAKLARSFQRRCH